MKLVLLLAFIVVLGCAHADDKDCPELDCKKEGPSCVVVKEDGSKCGRCSCNGTASTDTDSKHKAETKSEPSVENTKNATTAGTVAEDANSNNTIAVSKTKDKSQSKPETAAQGKEGATSDAASSSDHSPCKDCPEHCMITMFKGKCTGCVRVDDIDAECH